MPNLLASKPLIEDLILEIQGHKVMIDADLARLYGVTTKRLNEQVKRNKHRFPSDFMFKLKTVEFTELVANCDRFNRLKHSGTEPYVFTEHGALMLASILNSELAIKTSVEIIRAFVKMRTLLASHKELTKKIESIEETLSTHDEKIREILTVIKKLILFDYETKKQKVGFQL